MKEIFTLQQSQLIINNQLLKVSDQLGERDHPLHRLHDEIRQNNLGHLLQRRLALRLQQHPELLLNIQVDRIVLPRMIKRHAQPINKRLLVTRQLIGQQINAVRAHTLPRLSLCLADFVCDSLVSVEDSSSLQLVCEMVFPRIGRAVATEEGASYIG